MKLNKFLLKKLIKEVIKEANDITNPPSTEPSSASSSTGASVGSGGEKTIDFMKKQADGTIKLVVKGLGVKSYTQYKELVAKMAREAMNADLEIIRAEVEKSGKKKETMDPSELNIRGVGGPRTFDLTDQEKAVLAKPEYQDEASQERLMKIFRLTKDKKIPIENFDEDELAAWYNPKTSTEDRQILIKTSRIIKGQDKAAWTGMTKRDEALDELKNKKRKEMVAKRALVEDPPVTIKNDKGEPILKNGKPIIIRIPRYARNDEYEHPTKPGNVEYKHRGDVATEYLKDAEWDFVTQGGEIKASEKGTYRPSFKKSDRAGEGGKVTFAPISYSK